MSSSDESGSDRESHDDSSVGLSSFKPLSSPKSTSDHVLSKFQLRPRFYDP